MSLTNRKAPLRSIDCPDGWIVFQKEQGTIARAWTHAKFVTGTDAKDLVATYKNKFQREIPAHWLALPTGIDLQVHLRHPGQSQKETLEGGLESALYGGYDSVVTMPNTNPFLDTADALLEAIASCQKVAMNYPLRVGFTASATKGMQGQEPTNIGALAKAGAVAITDDGWGV
jgi:dihydroorotase